MNRIDAPRAGTLARTEPTFQFTGPSASRRGAATIEATQQARGATLDQEDSEQQIQ